MGQTEKMQVQERINLLMGEYSQRKKANEPPRALKRLTTEAYVLMMAGADTPCSRELYGVLRRYLNTNQIHSASYEPDDVMNECFLIAQESYDCQNNPNFWAYFLTLTRNWIFDKIYKKHTRIVGKDENGNPIREAWTIPDVLYNGDDEESTITESCPDQMLNPAEALELKENPDAGAKAKITKLISIVVDFYQHNQGKAANQEKLRYYRCFVTDYIICFAKKQVFEMVPVNEQDAFSAMDCKFLDYLMTNECRTLFQIELTPLKTYEQLSIMKKSGVIGTPLEGIVYKDYFSKAYQKTISDAAISQQRRAFHAFLGIDKHTHTWILPEYEEAKA